MNNTMTVTSLFDKIEKPSKPHIMDSQVPVTKEELNERLRKTAILGSVGISSSRFDGDDEHEDEDELQLRLLLSEGKAVPDELLERIKIRIHILRKINKCRGGTLLLPCMAKYAFGKTGSFPFTCPELP